MSLSNQELFRTLTSFDLFPRAKCLFWFPSSEGEHPGIGLQVEIDGEEQIIIYSVEEPDKDHFIVLIRFESKVLLLLPSLMNTEEQALLFNFLGELDARFRSQCKYNQANYRTLDCKLWCDPLQFYFQDEP